MTPPVDFMRSHDGIPPGTWSDDGSQALCLLASLLERGHLDPADLMDRFCRWFRDGYLAVDRNVFDVGLQTRQSIRKFLEGHPPLECASSGEWSNGNGSLMRVLPLALWHRGPDESMCRDAMVQSRTTHGHVRSAVCCALYCLWIRHILEAEADPWTRALDRFEELYPAGTTERTEYDTNIHPRDPDPAKGSGYVVDTLLSAVSCMEAGPYEDVVKAAVSLGNDTDTTACVAGGAAGVRDGLRGIPSRWRAKLRGKEIATPLLDAFLAFERSHEPPVPVEDIPLATILPHAGERP
jgi:ADP-ribosylglycohydrolase